MVLLGFEIEYAACVGIEFVVVYVVGVGYLKTIVHEVGTAERLALEGEGCVVDAVEFMHGVLAVGVESGHLDARQVLVDEALGLPPIEDGLVFGIRNVHERGYAEVVVG